MKIISPTSLIFALFLCTQVYAGISKDTLTVGKRTRTFATAPAVATYGVAVKTSAARGAVSTKGVNSGSEIITTKRTPRRTGVNSRYF